MRAPLNVISELANCAEWADRLVRADLMHGIVVSENDYTSNFTSALRREINSRAIPGVSAHSQVLTPRIERKTGTDGCIIFRNKSHFKVGLFEAKWPRLSTHTNCWDSMQKSTGKSHFDSQLARQHPLNNFAVWEMFYSEESYGANFFHTTDPLVYGMTMHLAFLRGGIRLFLGTMLSSQPCLELARTQSIK